MQKYDYVKCQICGVNFDDHSSVSPDCPGRKPVPEPEPQLLNGHSVNPNIPFPPLNAPEPPSQDSGNAACWDKVIHRFKDSHKGKSYCKPLVKIFRERNQIGIKKYGIPVMAHNGRNPIVDAFQEHLDALVYLAQAIEENENTDKLLDLISVYNSVEESIITLYILLEGIPTR